MSSLIGAADAEARIIAKRAVTMEAGRDDNSIIEFLMQKSAIFIMIFTIRIPHAQ